MTPQEKFVCPSFKESIKWFRQRKDYECVNLIKDQLKGRKKLFVILFPPVIQLNPPVFFSMYLGAHYIIKLELV